MNVHRFLFRTLLGRRLPRTSGKMEVPGISNSVTIRRDTYSIPYVEAESDEDAWYGVGFCRGTAEQLDVIAPHIRKVLDSFAHGRRRRELGGSSFRLPGSQSGNPLSPYYGDMLPLWKRGAGVPIAWSPELVASAARETLVLTPSDG